MTDDAMLGAVREFVNSHNGPISISLIQSKFSIGAIRAKKIMEAINAEKESKKSKPATKEAPPKVTDEELLIAIISAVNEDANVSITKLQKKYSISFNRAKRLLESAKNAIEIKNSVPAEKTPKKASKQSSTTDSKKITDEELEALILQDLIENPKITNSNIQKKYEIGFTRAKRLLESAKTLLENKKLAEASQPAKNEADTKILRSKNKNLSYRGKQYELARELKTGRIPRVKKLYRGMLRSNIKREKLVEKRQRARAAAIKNAQYTPLTVKLNSVRLPKKQSVQENRKRTIDCPVCDAKLIDNTDNDNVQCSNCGERFGKSDRIYQTKREKANYDRIIEEKRKKFRGEISDKDDEIVDKPKDTEPESNSKKINRRFGDRKNSTVGAANRRRRLARANSKKTINEIDYADDDAEENTDIVTPDESGAEDGGKRKKKSFIFDIFGNSKGKLKDFGIKLITKHILGNPAENASKGRTGTSSLDDILNSTPDSNPAPSDDNSTGPLPAPTRRPRRSKNRKPGESFEDFVTRILDEILEGQKEDTKRSRRTRPKNSDTDVSAKNRAKNKKSGHGNKLISALAKRGVAKVEQSMGARLAPVLGIAAVGSSILGAATMGVNAVMDKVLGQRDSDTSNTQASKNVVEFGSQFDAGKTVSGLSQDQTKALGGIIAEKESGLKYSGDKAWNYAGYVGAYQFGAEALEAVGLIKKGRYAAARKIYPNDKDWFEGGQQRKFLENASNWTIDGGVQTFLDSPRIQDKAFVDLANANIKYGKSEKVLNDNSTPEQIAGFAAAAHLKGAGNAVKLVRNGQSAADGLGSSNKSYYDNAAGNIGAVTKGIQDKAAGINQPEANTPKNEAAITGGPVPGARITSGFGPRDVKIGSSNHKGIDYGVPVGTSVYSIDKGTVSRVGNDPDGYGNWVEVDHGGGIKTRYAHLQKATVSDKQSVAAGQEVGKSGNTGASSGAHLHFEVRRNGEAVDAAAFLRQRAAERKDLKASAADEMNKSSPRNESVSKAPSTRGNETMSASVSAIQPQMDSSMQTAISKDVVQALTASNIGSVPEVQSGPSIMPFQQGGAESLRRKPASLERILNADSTRSV